MFDQRDILEFQMAFRDGSIRADFDGNFEVNGLDVAAFHQAWAAGCP